MAEASIPAVASGGWVVSRATAERSPGRQASAWAASALFVVPALDLVVMINAGHYSGPPQYLIPNGIFTDVVLPAVKDY